MPLTLPDARPADRTDFTTLRWSVRSDGRSGFVFVNNYQRLQPLPAKTNVQFSLRLPGGDLVFPPAPVTVPADAFFLWPFNLDLGGATLIYATAQPVCKIDEGGVLSVFFAETPGVPAGFAFDPTDLDTAKSQLQLVKPGREPIATLQTKSGKKIRIILLSEADSLALRKTDDGRNAVYEPAETMAAQKVETELVQPAGPAREIPLSGRAHVALAPTDADFTKAAVWKVRLPRPLDFRGDPRLRIHYAGDVARVTLNGRLLDDDFYCGRNFEIGLKRYAPEITTGDLRLEILPLRRDAPVYFEPGQRPDFGTNATVLRLESVEIVDHF
jgi:hypothetical protein